MEIIRAVQIWHCWMWLMCWMCLIYPRTHHWSAALFGCLAFVRWKTSIFFYSFFKESLKDRRTKGQTSCRDAWTHLKVLFSRDEATEGVSICWSVGRSVHQSTGWKGRLEPVFFWPIRSDLCHVYGGMVSNIWIYTATAVSPISAVVPIGQPRDRCSTPLA